METTVKNIGLLFTGILLVVIWGFSHTFLKLFTAYSTSNLAQFLHQIAFLLWFALLIPQYLFVKYKKIAVYKALKSFSYVLAPLVTLAICCAAKEQYLQDIAQLTKSEAIAKQALDLPNLVAFASLYFLAITAQKNVFIQKRFFVAGTLVLVGLGLSHLFEVYIHFPFSMSVLLSYIITDLVLITLLVNDKIYGYTSMAYVVSLAVFVATQMVWFFLQNTNLWQEAAGKFVQAFF